MLLSIIRKNEKLAEKRNPLYERNRFAKIIIYFMIAFWAAYLIFIGVMLPFVFRDSFPSMEPYHIFNMLIFIILFIDFILRFLFQQNTSQEIKPYLLFPVKKKTIIYSFLFRSALNKYNLIGFFLFIPFALITIPKYYGFTGVLSYILGLYLLIIMNNYWQRLCKTLIQQGIIFYLLPILFYLAIICLEFFIKGNIISKFTMNLGEAFILGNLLYFIITILAIIALVIANEKIERHYLYNELSKVNDTKISTVSDYKFLNNFGLIGTYLKLELRLALRNKTVKHQVRMGFVIMIAFSMILGFTDTYDTTFMTNFICIYNFSIFAILYMSSIMSYEGNYLDGLMSRKGSILNILKAKYYINCLVLLIPFIFLLIPVSQSKISLFMVISYFFFTAGFVLAVLMQLAVYNKKSIPLNTIITRGNRGKNLSKTLLSSCAITIPLILNSILTSIFEQGVAYSIILFIGLIFIITHNIWICNIYKRFMKRRYENMEGFRQSR